MLGTSRSFVLLAFLLVGCEGLSIVGPAERTSPATCGDGMMAGEEACDDGNRRTSDGCDSSCIIELGFECSGQPSQCAPVCGDGLRRGEESCDDGTRNGTLGGCSLDCRPRPGFACVGEGSGSCRPICGDGRVAAGEHCDDGNLVSGDGCSELCAREDGFVCEYGEPTTCSATCGDGIMLGGETCDDGNLLDGDTCSSSCVRRFAWRPLTLGQAPIARWSAATAWTGSEWFIWGGLRDGWVQADGGLFSPSSGTWRIVNTDGAPSLRATAVAAWTQNEVIVWGGRDLNERVVGDGALFDPRTNRWRPMDSRNAPSPRWGAVGVFTDHELFVFGGTESYPTRYMPAPGGGLYDPVQNAWRPLSTINAPSSRWDHSVVWTGTHVIVFGGATNPTGRADPGDDGDPRGFDGVGTPLQDGAIYDPRTDSWRPLSLLGAPSPRLAHAAVWTGTEMIVYGGTDKFRYLSDGAAYDPIRDVWRPIASRPPEEGASLVYAAWTGSEMIVAGGWPETHSPAKYIPLIDTWVAWSPNEAPSIGAAPLGAITANELLLYGGILEVNPFTRLDEGGSRYDLRSGTWSPIAGGSLVNPRAYFSAVQHGNSILLWGGLLDNQALDDGVRIDVVSGILHDLPQLDAPSPRWGHTAVVTENEMIVWGGFFFGFIPNPLGDGGSYDLNSGRWASLPDEGAPSPRWRHGVVFTGTEMIVFGGDGGLSGLLGDGGRFDVGERVWRPMADVSALLEPRRDHTMVFTGQEVIVWGGSDGQAELATGARYDPAHDHWRPMTMQDAPEARAGHRAVWTGREMIVWGGSHDHRSLDTGARYDPVADVWRPLPTNDAPKARFDHSMTWTGRQMVVFGGSVDSQFSVDDAADGGRYDPALDAWFPLPEDNRPTPRANHAAFWFQGSLVIWGGISPWSAPLWSGAFLDL